MIGKGPIRLWSKDLSAQGAIKKALADADHYARNKRYPCLFPGCNDPAISSHSIQKHLLSKALAEKGKLFTIEQSFLPKFSRPTFEWFRDIREIGIADAGTFRGYCPSHDSRLFAPAETANSTEREGLIEALHMRGLSLHYSRQRRCFDLFDKLSNLLSDRRNKENCEKIAEGYKDDTAMFDLLYLKRGMTRNFPNKHGVSYYCIPILHNVGVSCSGCFRGSADWNSGIAYNLISFPDMTIILLTVFEAMEPHLSTFTRNYSFPHDVGRLVNEIAFAKSEEPLIAYRIWHNLTSKQKQNLRLSLRDRNLHDNKTPVIQITPAEIVPATPDIYSRLGLSLQAQDNAVD